MENNSNIVWAKNIVEVFARMKKPIEESTWRNLLRQGILRAGNAEDQEKLEAWWDTGWKETPTLPNKAGVAKPIMKVRQSALGDTLAAVYPRAALLAAEGIAESRVSAMCNGRRYPEYDWYIIPLREITDGRYVGSRFSSLPWTLFAADHTIIGQYATQKEMCWNNGISIEDAYRAHKYNFNELADGRWFWMDDWGLLPITPQDEFLDFDWRTKNLSKNR